MKLVVGLLFAIAFGAMGLLVGTLCGLSASPIAQTLVSLTFGLIGGSILHIFTRMEVADRIFTLVALLMFSLGAIGGVFGGIYINENQLLTPPEQRADGGDRRYLSGETCVDAVKSDVTRGLAKDAAYDALVSRCLTDD